MGFLSLKPSHFSVFPSFFFKLGLTFRGDFFSLAFFFFFLA